MRRTLSILCSSLVIGGASADDKAVLRFTNEDSITGNFNTLTESSLSWEAEWLQEPATFNLSNILDVTIPTTAAPPAADHVAVLQLKNGDIARGQLTSVTDESINLNTWYAGPISFNTLMVSSVNIEGSGPLLYQGPTSIDGWEQSEKPPAWEYKNASFISGNKGSIAHKNILPDECSINFKLQWKSDDLNFKVYLFSDRPGSDNPDSGYELSLRRTSAYLRKGTNRRYLGSTRISQIAQNQEVSIEIKASRRNGTVALLIDGELNEVWMDPNMKEGRFGTALHFIAMNSLPTRVSKIAVKPWDGEIDAAPNKMIGRGRLLGRINPPAPKPSKEDEDEKNKNLMKLANGDSITGEVNKIENGIASLKTPLGELAIPVSRLRTLALKQLGKSEPKIENGDIRVGFADGSSLVFKLEKVENGKIIGSNQTFGINSERGTEAFDMSTISRIEFNLYEEDYKNIRNQETW